jgi:hypothetical protein
MSRSLRNPKGTILTGTCVNDAGSFKTFQIESDASKYTSGAVLTQTDINGDRHLVAFLSKTFTDTERRYEIYDRELLGIVRALKEW